MPSLLALMDVIATLLGQPEAYWNGNLDVATDANPAVVYALKISPWLAAPAAVAWVLMLTVFMLTLAPPWRRCIYIFFSLAHLTFVWTWVVQWNLSTGIAFVIFAILIIQVMHLQLKYDRISITKENAANL